MITRKLFQTSIGANFTRVLREFQRLVSGQFLFPEFIGTQLDRVLIIPGRIVIQTGFYPVGILPSRDFTQSGFSPDRIFTQSVFERQDFYKK